MRGSIPPLDGRKDASRLTLTPSPPARERQNSQSTNDDPSQHRPPALGAGERRHGSRRQALGQNFLLYSVNAEDYARVEFTTGNYIIRCADNISKGLATRFYGESAAMSSSMRYNVTSMLAVTQTTACPRTSPARYDATVSCTTWEYLFDAHRRFRFVKPSWQTGVIDNILEDGYATYIQDTFTGNYCTNWMWPSNNAGMKCIDAAPSSTAHVYHFRWPK
jgi:hypothetical protein